MRESIRRMEKLKAVPMPTSDYLVRMNSELKRELRQKLGPMGCTGGTGFPVCMANLDMA